jgi:nuclear pore complex protein Nup62
MWKPFHARLNELLQPMEQQYRQTSLWHLAFHICHVVQLDNKILTSVCLAFYPNSNIYAYMCISMYMHVCMYLFLCMYVCMYVCMIAYAYVHMYAGRVYVYVYMYVCVYNVNVC